MRRRVKADAESARFVDGALASTPPAKIGSGHMLPDAERDARRTVERFAPVTVVKRQAAPERLYHGHGVRPGGRAPDKRTKVEPAPCVIPSRSGGTILL